jgi:ribosomal protein S18 acetylase RimI-like enzyme
VDEIDTKVSRSQNGPMPHVGKWTLRRAVPEDATAVAAVHVASWREAYRGIVAESFLDAMLVSDRAGRYTFGLDGPDDPRTWIALNAQDIVGFVTTGPSRDENVVASGEIFALYVAPSYWRSGAGTLLMGKAEEELRAHSWQRAALWVLEANDQSRAFYEAQGWRADGTTDHVAIGEQFVAKVRYQKQLSPRRG